MNALTMAFVCITLAVSTMGEVDKGMLMRVSKKCMEESHATEDEMKKLMNRETPTTQSGKCMMACLFKVFGVLTEKGMFEEQSNIMKMVEENFKEKPEKIEMVKTIISLCKDQINKLVDDEKGCERAVIINVCSMEKSKELGYKMEN